MGKLVHVEIIETTKFSMIGQVVEDEKIVAPNSNGASQKDSTFQGSIFYKLSMFMLVMACLVRVFHLFQVNIGNEKNGK